MTRQIKDERFGVGKIKKILEVEAVVEYEGGPWVKWKIWAERGQGAPHIWK